MSPDQAERRLAAILSADVVDYSRLMADDEARTVQGVTRCRELVERLVPRHRGRLVDFTGDNFLAEFPSATGATTCAFEIHEAMRAEFAEFSTEQRMQLRMGLHLGEILVEGARVFGSGVNIAARLEGLAEGGGLCVSAVVREQLRSLSGYGFRSLGVRQLKNISGDIEVFGVVREADERGGAAKRSASAPSVAVLPFANMSSDPDQQFFADGMSEELINALTRVEGLRVIARTSAFSFKDSNADIATIGNRLKVEHVVEGSVRKAGNRLRITAQLVEVAGGHHLWSEAFDRSLDDVFEVQNEIALRVVEAIRPRLMGASTPLLVQPTTRNSQAYELYLRAGDRLWRTEQGDTRTAIEMLKDAIAIDPNYADAWARLAHACCQMEVAFDPDPRWHAQANEAVQRAFELNPNSAEAHLAHARIVWSPAAGFQNEAALRSVSRALELQPGSHPALIWRGMYLFHVGLFDESREALTAAQAAEPRDPMTINAMTQLDWLDGRYEDAAGHLSKLLEVAPGFAYGHLITSVLWIYLDDLDRAERAIATARGLLGDEPILDANEALLWARRGDEPRTLELLARAAQERKSFGHRHHAQHHAAAACAVLGRAEEAVELLRDSCSCGLPNYPLFAKDPHFQNMAEHPGMKQLLAELARSDTAFRAEFGRTQST